MDAFSHSETMKEIRKRRTKQIMEKGFSKSLGNLLTPSQSYRVIVTSLFFQFDKLKFHSEANSTVHTRTRVSVHEITFFLSRQMKTEIDNFKHVNELLLCFCASLLIFIL